METFSLLSASHFMERGGGGGVSERITESTVNVARCTCTSEITEKIGEKLIG